MAAPSRAPAGHARPVAAPPGAAPVDPAAGPGLDPEASAEFPDPGSWTDVIDQRALRDVLGGYATGVAVVAAALDGERYGMAVNSFTSVSLDPPLVAFCAARTSSTWPGVRRAGAFAVSILDEDQEAVSRVLARRGADRFAAPEVADAWTTTPAGTPVLRDALGWLDCTIDAIHPAGDHELVLGRVWRMSRPGAGRPLLYFRGAYARLAPDGA